MSDLINRQDAIEYFMTNTNWHDEDGYTIEDAEEKRKLITDYFDGVPSAERKRVEWIKDKNGVFICSNCNNGYKNQPTLMGKPMFQFCPYCGARMDERREDET